MTTPINSGGPFRSGFSPLRSEGPAAAGRVEGEAPPDAGAVSFRGRTVQAVREPQAALEPRAAAVLSAVLGAAGAGPAPSPAAPGLEARQVTHGGAVPSSLAERRNGQEMIGVRLAASALADGPLFRTEMQRAGLEPALLGERKREAVDRLMGQVPVSAEGERSVAQQVVTEALAAVLAVVAGNTSPSDPAAGAAVAKHLAARALERAEDALRRGGSDFAMWLGEAALRTSSAEVGGGAPSARDAAQEVTKLFDSLMADMPEQSTRAAVVAEALTYIENCAFVRR